MLLLVLVEHVDEELHVGHVLNADRLADGVDLDLKLLLGIDTLAPLEGFVVNQVWSLIDQETEDLLHPLVLLPSGVLVLCGNALVIHELTLRLSLGVVTALRVHN